LARLKILLPFQQLLLVQVELVAAQMEAAEILAEVVSLEDHIVEAAPEEALVREPMAEAVLGMPEEAVALA
jgi:hypothetical protein